MNILDQMSEICKHFETTFKNLLETTTEKDLPEITNLIRNESLQVGIKIFQLWYDLKIGNGYQGSVLERKSESLNVKQYSFKGKFEKTYTCCLGDVTLKRAYYSNPEEDKGIFPTEESYPCFKDKFLPDVKKMACLVSSIDPYNISSMILKKIGGIFISASSLEQITRNIGSELGNKEDIDCQNPDFNDEDKNDNKKKGQVLAVSADGAMINTKDGWKEVKSGAVYEISNDRNKTYAIKKSYVSRIENCESFGTRIAREAHRRGINNAGTVVCIGDGARWIWDQFNLHFPGSVEIIDWYHATEHLWKITELLFKDKALQIAREWEKKQEDKLYNCKVSDIIKSVKKKLLMMKTESKNYKDLKSQLGYFEQNKERMQYRIFKEKGYPIGSGVIEGVCKNLVQIRMKRAGMRWTKLGAHAVLQLRCFLLSNRWNEVEQHLKWVA
ncbi:MAG: ISKra4 family transposase [Cyclobacteriaceae bacterium]|nr:ISKra4 family transposase [Cyclobacteriaceae bacterium]